MAAGMVDRVLSVALTTAAIGLAAVVGVSEIRSLRTPAAQPGRPGERTFIDDWHRLPWKTYVVGDSAKPVQIVEFTDLECPACRKFHTVILPATLEEFGDQVGFSVIHLPLPGHRFAIGGARGTTCAASKGRAAAFLGEVFRRQDSIGLRTWGSFAAAAGISDTLAFGECMRDLTRTTIVDSGLALAARLDIRATPSLFVNGWLVPNQDAELRRVIRELLRGRMPYPEVEASRIRRIRLDRLKG